METGSSQPNKEENMIANRCHSERETGVRSPDDHHRRCGGRACTGCLTGNPCPACIARQERMKEATPLAGAVSDSRTGAGYK